MMHLIARVCILVTLTVVLQRPFLPEAAPKPKQRLIVRLLTLDLCREDVSSLHAGNFSFRHVGKSVVADGDVIFRRPAKQFSALEIRITRCSDAVSFNTCEYFDTWKYTFGVCGILTAKQMPWSTWVGGYAPPFRCPFKAGRYLIRNATVDVSVVEALGFRLENNVWIVDYQVYDDLKKPFICYNFTIDFKRVREGE